jgi:predicted permease
VDASLQRYDAARTERLYADARNRLRANPNVRAASWVSILPLSGDRITESFVLDPGASEASDATRRSVRANAVGASYFHAMGIPILEGRDFVAEDNKTRGPVAIVSRAFARRYFPSASPIGHRVSILNRTAEIVGVAGDSTYEQLWLAPVPFLYLPIEQAEEPMAATLVVRTDRDPRALLSALRGALAESASDVPILDLFVLRDQLATILMPQRFAATLLGLLAGLAIVLASVGIYGVTAYAVAQRTREIGIRMALGATARDIARLVLAGVARPVVVGALGGVLAAIAARRAIGSFLYNVGMFDVTTFAIAATCVLVATLLATVVPSRRAIAIDPAESLRAE